MMPFRQKMVSFCGAASNPEVRLEKEENGRVREVVDTRQLPKPEDFTLAAQVAAGINLTENRPIYQLEKEQPNEPSED